MSVVSAYSGNRCGWRLWGGAALAAGAFSAFPAHAQQQAELPAPAIDYHVHLLGPYALPVERPLTPVRLPADLQRFLDRHARQFGSIPSILELRSTYARGALVLDGYVDTRWMSDLSDIGRWFTLFGKEVRFVPNRVDVTGRHAVVAGSGSDTRGGRLNFNFLINLVRESGGWRIASETVTWKAPPRFTDPIPAERIVADMDKGGIRRALVLSEAFWIGGAGGERQKRLIESPTKVIAVQRENDWTAAQVARFPGRLAMACGLNPLEGYALAELRRCMTIPQTRAIKVNVGGGGDNIDLHDPRQVAKLRAFFAEANRLKAPIVIHLGSAERFGREEVTIFLEQVVAVAPDIAIQVAHMSSGFQHPEALAAFADARAAANPLARNLYFDLSIGSFKAATQSQLENLAGAIRKIGVDHVLYGSDEQPGDQHAPTWRHWKEIVERLPLTQDEFRSIASNVAPYMRD